MTATATEKTAKTEAKKEAIKTVVKLETEDTSVLEDSWGPKKAEAMYLLFEEASKREGEAKRTRSRVAADTRTSLGFIQGLASYTVTYGRGKAKLANRKREEVLKVLDALGSSEKDFLGRLK